MEAAEIIKGLRDKTGMTEKGIFGSSGDSGTDSRGLGKRKKDTAGIHPASDCISVKV